MYEETEKKLEECSNKSNDILSAYEQKSFEYLTNRITSQIIFSLTPSGAENRLPPGESVFGQFGSPNSNDMDLFVDVKSEASNDLLSLLKEYIDILLGPFISVGKVNHKTTDIQFVNIENGFVQWASKGDPRELNNSIFYTFNHHPFNYYYMTSEEFENPVSGSFNLDVGLKAIKTVRGILTSLSRTEIRKEIKPLLLSKSFSEKIECIGDIFSSGFLENVEGFGKNISDGELLKDLCFSNIQLNAMLNNVDVPYTKDEVLLSMGYSQYWRLVYNLSNTDEEKKEDKMLLKSLISINMELLQMIMVKDDNGIVKFEGDNCFYNMRFESIEYEET